MQCTHILYFHACGTNIWVFRGVLLNHHSSLDQSPNSYLDRSPTCDWIEVVPISDIHDARMQQTIQIIIHNPPTQILVTGHKSYISLAF